MAGRARKVNGDKNFFRLTSPGLAVSDREFGVRRSDGSSWRSQLYFVNGCSKLQPVRRIRNQGLGGAQRLINLNRQFAALAARD